MELVVAILVGLAFAFAFSMGAHYTGACMGMAYASGAIRLRNALVLMAPLTFLGALLVSGGVEQTVGHGLLAVSVPVGLAVSILVSAFALTSAFNVVRIPTSTIQILVFSVVGVGLERNLPIHWGTIGTLLVLWAVAPVVAFGVGFAIVKSADIRKRPILGGATAVRGLAIGLVGMGAAASVAMGANDVSNASGAFIMTGLFDPRTAALIGGIGLALGVLTWGRPLLQKVAFDVVRLDGLMATAAQLAQAAVILGYVAFGFFTSMNQALVGAMIGTAYARQTGRIRWTAVRDILAGWAVGPVSGAAFGFAGAWVLSQTGWA